MLGFVDWAFFPVGRWMVSVRGQAQHQCHALVLCTARQALSEGDVYQVPVDNLGLIKSRQGSIQSAYQLSAQDAFLV